MTRDEAAWSIATYAVWVNEVNALTYGYKDSKRAERWAAFSVQRPGTRYVGMWEAELPALDREHAEWLRDYLVSEVGLSKAWVKVRVLDATPVGGGS